MLALKVVKSLRLKKLADILFRRPGSNRGYLNGDILTTLVAMQTDGATSLSGVLRLRTESALLKLVGIRKIQVSIPYRGGCMVRVKPVCV